MLTDSEVVAPVSVFQRQSFEGCWGSVAARAGWLPLAGQQGVASCVHAYPLPTLQQLAEYAVPVMFQGAVMQQQTVNL